MAEARNALAILPAALKCWFAVLFFLVASSAYWSLDKGKEQIFEHVNELLRLPQSLVFAWICCNLLQNERVAGRAIKALVAGALVASVCMFLGMGAQNLGTEGEARMTMGGLNANEQAMFLGLGAVACLGLFLIESQRAPLLRYA